MPADDSKWLDLRLSDLSTFLAVARFGSIHGAARGLQVSPSQVMQSVERLERRLNMDLLTRGQRGVSVSPAGRVAVPRFEAILSEFQQLQSAQGEPRQQLHAGRDLVSQHHFRADHRGARCRRLRAGAGATAGGGERLRG